MHRPLLVLEEQENIEVPELSIEGDDGGQVVLNGLVISGGRLRIRGRLSSVTLRHCTLVPGLDLLEDGMPRYPGEASIIVDAEQVTFTLDSCIVGAIQVVKEASVRISNSIVDANDIASLAYGGIEAAYRRNREDRGDRRDRDEVALGGDLSIENSTVIGRLRTCSLAMASNTIFLATSQYEEGVWEEEVEEAEEFVEPIYVQRIQEGGVRYSYIPVESRVPRRYKCPLAQDMARLHLTSFRYGEAGYAQLSKRCPTSITQGADDGAEMGAFHLLYQPQRETNLYLRLAEYLRFDMQPELLYMT